jgi:fido (protein-threonine AMPylation protein)
MELVASYLDRAEPVALTTTVIQHVHAELMGAIYPFAGQWRTVSLHKGDGPTKWPLPPGGIEPQMAVMERDRVLALALRLGRRRQGLRVRR